jgi:hypothetical protein
MGVLLAIISGAVVLVREDVLLPPSSKYEPLLVCLLYGETTGFQGLFN